MCKKCDIEAYGPEMWVQANGEIVGAYGLAADVASIDGEIVGPS